MKKRIAVFLMIVSFVFLNCGKQKVYDHSFTIVYSNNIGGRIEPCGCRIPLGGMERRAGYLKELKNEVDNLLVLDGGVLYFGKTNIHDLLVKKYKIHVDIITRCMNYMGLDVLNIGSNDFKAGLDFIEKIGDQAEFQIISANFRERESGNRIFQPYVLKEVDGIKVGIFGIMADNFNGIQHFDEDDPYTIGDLMKESNNMVNELSSKAGLIIALANMEFYQAIELARKFPMINVILLSHLGPIKVTEALKPFSPVIEGNTIIIRTPDDGRVVGRLDINIRNGSLEFVNDTRMAELRKMSPDGKLPTDTEQSTFANSFIKLSSDYEGDEEIKMILKSKDSELEALAIEINTHRTEQGLHVTADD